VYFHENENQVAFSVNFTEATQENTKQDQKKSNKKPPAAAVKVNLQNLRQGAGRGGKAWQTKLNQVQCFSPSQSETSCS